MRPRLLDLFCGAGGAAMGYHRAGFDVVGVDNRPQPNYPFEFVQADALDVLGERHVDLVDRDQRSPGLATCGDSIRHLVGGAAVAVGDFDVQVDEDLAGHVAPSFGVDPHSPKPALRVKDFDAIHASPPCQAYSQTQRLHGRDHHPQLIGTVRDLLEAVALPWVIENVAGAPMEDPVVLCGSMFGLDVKRHRLFECSFPVWLRPACAHGVWEPRRFRTHAKKDKSQLSPIVHIYGTGGGEGKDLELWKRTMDVPWMKTKAEVSEAIPPAYTELIGHELLQHLQVTA